MDRKLTTKATMSSKNKFLSVIKQARVRQAEGSRSRFAEFEILCQMRSVGLGIEKEKVYKWSVWRRYSEIKTLFYKMKNTLGMSAILFRAYYRMSLRVMSYVVSSFQ